MLCKNLRSSAKNSHTRLFFHPVGAALVRIPLINKTKKTFGGFYLPKGFWRRRGGIRSWFLQRQIRKTIYRCFAKIFGQLLKTATPGCFFTLRVPLSFESLWLTKRKNPSDRFHLPKGFWRRQRDSNPRAVADKRFSRPPRYDRFDMPPHRVKTHF